MQVRWYEVSFCLIFLLSYLSSDTPENPGGIAIVCAILGIMRPKDIAINIIYKILQPNVKLFCVMTRHFARPVFAVPFQNIVYSLSYVQRTLCHCDTIYSLSSVQRTLCHYNVVTLPGDCHSIASDTSQWRENLRFIAKNIQYHGAQKTVSPFYPKK